jgi:hypothetical protein
MLRIKLNRELAQRASWDAANANMRTNGRKAWNEDDANVAWREFNRLWPLCAHGVEPGECWICDAEKETSLLKRA